jgi:hypothetical protein
MSRRLLRTFLFAAFAVSLALAPVARADEDDLGPRTTWRFLSVWFWPFMGSSGTVNPGFDLQNLEIGAGGDPYGRASSPIPDPVPVDTTDGGPGHDPFG